MSEPAEPKQAGSRRANIVIIGFLVIFVATLAGLALYASRNDANRAEVGDCVAQTGDASLEVVGCDDPSTEFEVVGRVEDKNQIEAGISACVEFTDAEKSYWYGEEGGTGLVLCLAPLDR